MNPAPVVPGMPRPSMDDSDDGDDTGGTRPTIPGATPKKEEEAPKPPVAQGPKIELYTAEVDVYGEVKVQVETHEANVAGKEDFRLRLDKVPCFHDVKRRDIGPAVSTGRHADWVRFELTFHIKCPKKGDVEAAKKEAEKKVAADKAKDDAVAAGAP